METKAKAKVKKKKKGLRRGEIALYIMLIVPMLYFIVFSYAPMLGIQIAFKKFNVFKGMWESPWIGFDWFVELFTGAEFPKALANTLILSLGGLILNFPFPIVFAILLNELVHTKLKNFTQLILYLPHFLSTVIISGIVYQVFGASGVINNIITGLGGDTINFMTDTGIWRWIYWGSNVWSGLGYGMIVYLAAMAGINIELYDAAYIDGAGRWKRIWHVTLPQIKPTIVTLLIMNVGKVLNVGFERPYMMGNVAVQDVSEVIATYVYRIGLQAGRYDYATAVGLFQSVVAVVLVLSANAVAKKLGEEGLM